MREIVLVGGIDEGIYTVVDILLYGVVDRAFATWRACSVVIDPKTATAVNEIHVISHLMKLDIEHRSLAQGCLNTTYLGNLASYMKMYQAQAVAHTFLV